MEINRNQPFSNKEIKIQFNGGIFRPAMLAYWSVKNLQLKSSLSKQRSSW